MKNKSLILIALFVSMSFVVFADRNEPEGTLVAEANLSSIVSPQLQKQRDILRGKILLWELERELRYKKKLTNELRIIRSEQRSSYLRQQIDIRLQNISMLQYELLHLRNSLSIKNR